MTARKTRTFKSGNSVALRLPKALGVDAGIEMTVREERGRYIVEPFEEPIPGKKIDLTGIYGSVPPGTFRIFPDEYDDIPRDWHLLGLDPR
ncbi:MAG TPA: AbrB/MazE/SpoVT family DNA-binding domain-containing protein [Allosphingosinicella sp.]|nr:AbrB/MazE/SpoVT family DNA-binding domain-containing protein [Allosphingosinicella sp.]